MGQRRLEAGAVVGGVVGLAVWALMIPALGNLPSPLNGIAIIAAMVGLPALGAIIGGSLSSK